MSLGVNRGSLGLIGAHWESLGVIWGSLAFNRYLLGVIGASLGSLRLVGGHWALIMGLWGSLGFIGCLLWIFGSH